MPDMKFGSIPMLKKIIGSAICRSDYLRRLYFQSVGCMRGCQFDGDDLPEGLAAVLDEARNALGLYRAKLEEAQALLKKQKKETQNNGA